jgi:uncharacterized protein with HEPN domain
VDVATPRGLKARIRDRVLAEAVALWETTVSVWRTSWPRSRGSGATSSDRARFDIDELLQSAVRLWIEIIGEAARGVSDEVRAAHPEVPSRVITDMRNWVSHGWWRLGPVDLTSTDYARIADLVNTYEHLPLEVTDASDVAIAEPLGLTEGRR